MNNVSHWSTLGRCFHVEIMFDTCSYLFHLDIHRRRSDAAPWSIDYRRLFSCRTCLNIHIYCHWSCSTIIDRVYDLLPRYGWWLGRYFERHWLDFVTRSSYTCTRMLVLSFSCIHTCSTALTSRNVRVIFKFSQKLWANSGYMSITSSRSSRTILCRSQ
jgi:hypothetical protein